MDKVTAFTTPAVGYVQSSFETIITPALDKLIANSKNMADFISGKIDEYRSAMNGSGQDAGDTVAIIEPHALLMDDMRKNIPDVYCMLVQAADCYDKLTKQQYMNIPQSYLKCPDHSYQCPAVPILAGNDLREKLQNPNSPDASHAPLIFIINTLKLYKLANSKQIKLSWSQEMFKKLMSYTTFMTLEELSSVGNFA